MASSLRNENEAAIVQGSLAFIAKRRRFFSEAVRNSLFGHCV
ncbi:MAG: hypothetical protein ACLGJD_03650 [Gammaproteobacteria bacterium]|nr:hypothetical protein [uncultured Pseudacidovorax sp.]